MKINAKNIFLTSSFLLITCLLIIRPEESLLLSLTGLQLWFNRMIPTLLPFMILSGMMIRLQLTDLFIKAVRPVLSPLLPISSDGLYAVITGFLCGFPMGAHVIADLYSYGRLSRKEAAFLLSFCNNIGPIYFISFVLPSIGVYKKVPYLFGMYGLPLLYGIFLKHFFLKEKTEVVTGHGAPPLSFTDALDDSVMSGLLNIAKLGGYMILFNLLTLPAVCIASPKTAAIFGCLFEITSGISHLGRDGALFILLLLPAGGLSCMAQTYSMIRKTDLSFKNYLFHKCMLTGITITYYMLWRLLSPSTFLL